MENKLPSNFTRVRELIDQLRICSQLDTEMTNILENIYTHMYGIDENYRRMMETSRKHTEQISSLEKRYSELLYALSNLRESIK